MSPRPSKASDPINIKAVALVREALAGSGFTRQLLAALSGVPDGTLAGMLAGTKPIYVDQLVCLGIALKADISEWIAELEAVAKATRPEVAATASVFDVTTPDELAARRKRVPSDPARTVRDTSKLVAKRSQEKAGASEFEE